MPFSASDLRYHLEQSYPALCIYLQHRAQRHLGQLAFDAFEMDQVVGHVIEHLARIRLLGGGDQAPKTALDELSNAQFYTFLNRMVQNKAIDRLRRRRLPMSTTSELEAQGNPDDDNDPLNSVVEPFWGDIPFANPEAAALAVVAQEELRLVLKKCIETLSAAPRQLQAILQELQALGAVDLIKEVQADLPVELEGTALTHLSQHKDHAHKKLRLCLQKSSSNLAVMVAIRLTEYGAQSNGSDELSVPVETLMQGTLSLREVQMGLQHLTKADLLAWQGEAVVRMTPAQQRQLTRFYEQE
jgi:DNA-directed RNA polymerase specialized sigma24 family protein